MILVREPTYMPCNVAKIQKKRKRKRKKEKTKRKKTGKKRENNLETSPRSLTCKQEYHK